MNLFGCFFYDFVRMKMKNNVLEFIIRQILCVFTNKLEENEEHFIIDRVILTTNMTEKGYLFFVNKRSRRKNANSLHENINETSRFMCLDFN